MSPSKCVTNCLPRLASGKCSVRNLAFHDVQVVQAQPQVRLVAANPYAALMAAAAQQAQQKQQDQEAPIGGDPRSFAEDQIADLLAAQEQDSHTVLDAQV